MAFTVSDFRDLIQLLEQHPDWRTELRRWVLTEELLALPQMMRELVAVQGRTEERMGQLTARVDGLTQQMAQLTSRVDSLTQGVIDLTQQMQQLTRRMDDLTQRLVEMADMQLRMGRDLEYLKGHDLERRYRERAPAYFGRLLRRVHALSNDELLTLLDTAVGQGQLSEDEADEILQADVVVRGRHREDGTAIYLVVEVSWGVGLSDVQRAAERATLLARLGTPTLPVVAGFWVIPEAQESAQSFQVWQVTDGRVTPPGVRG